MAEIPAQAPAPGLARFGGGGNIADDAPRADGQPGASPEATRPGTAADDQYDAMDAGYVHPWTAFSATSQPPPSLNNEADEEWMDPDKVKPMRWQQAVGLTADIAGIVDPTPACDAASALVSLADGDLRGFGLSVVSAAVPYAGDAIAKPVKLAKAITEAFPSLARVVDKHGVDGLWRVIRLAGPEPSKVTATLRALDNIHEGAAEAYARNPKWLQKVESLGLPADGPVSFVPPKRWDPNAPLREGRNGGYFDAYGNTWSKGPSRTKGETFEWDVTLKNPKGGLGNLAHEGGYLNVSRGGVPTHK